MSRSTPTYWRIDRMRRLAAPSTPSSPSSGRRPGTEGSEESKISTGRALSRRFKKFSEARSRLSCPSSSTDDDRGDSNSLRLQASNFPARASELSLQQEANEAREMIQGSGQAISGGSKNVRGLKVSKPAHETTDESSEASSQGVARNSKFKFASGLLHGRHQRLAWKRKLQASGKGSESKSVSNGPAYEDRFAWKDSESNKSQNSHETFSSFGSSCDGDEDSSLPCKNKGVQHFSQRSEQLESKIDTFAGIVSSKKSSRTDMQELRTRITPVLSPLKEMASEGSEISPVSSDCSSRVLSKRSQVEDHSITGMEQSGEGTIAQNPMHTTSGIHPEPGRGSNLSTPNHGGPVSTLSPIRSNTCDAAIGLETELLSKPPVGKTHTNDVFGDRLRGSMTLIQPSESPTEMNILGRYDVPELDSCSSGSSGIDGAQGLNIKWDEVLKGAAAKRSISPSPMINRGGEKSNPLTHSRKVPQVIEIVDLESDVSTQNYWYPDLPLASRSVRIDASLMEGGIEAIDEGGRSRAMRRTGMSYMHRPAEQRKHFSSLTRVRGSKPSIPITLLNSVATTMEDAILWPTTVNWSEPDYFEEKSDDSHQRSESSISQEPYP